VSDHGFPPPGSDPSRGPYDAPPGLGQRTSRGRLGWLVTIVAVILVGLLVWFVVVNKSKPVDEAGGGSGPPGAGGPPGGGRGGPGGGSGGGSGGGRRGGAVVNTAVAQAGEMPVVVQALGTVTPTATVTVKTQLSGQLMSVGFTEGQTVNKGQFLAQVDPRPYQQQLAQAEAAAAKDRAQLANARADLKRYQTLLAQDSVSRQQVDTQATLVSQLEAQVKADQAAIGAQKLNLTYARITSPIAGKVGLRQVDAGNYVTPGDANGIVTVTQVSPIDVAFTLPEDVLPKVNQQLSHHARLAVEVYDRAQTEVLARGSLATLDNLVDTTTGTVRAKARFANADGALFPNQFVNVRLTVEVLKKAVIVPTSAVLRGQNGMFVYAVDSAKSVHIRPVVPGPAQGELTAVMSGLSPGETVVTDGTDRLREGMKVMTPPPCPPGAAGAGAGGGWRKGSGSGGASAFGGKRSGGGAGAGSAGCRPAATPAAGQAAGPSATPAATPGAAPSASSAAAPAAGGSEGGGAGRLQAMLAELNLDPQQQQKADALFADAREKAMAQLGDTADPDARRAAMKAAYGQAFGKLSTILRPEQKAKLIELRAKMAAQGGGAGGGNGPQR
jgi:membrane fusion protein, multidrug efflux system